ncbi:MAG TPA: hypothetical protein VGP55_10595, partial [Chitinophagaceae bacterium]|nr:hypothetical protein [Chitinophagaceae bacterium]
MPNWKEVLDEIQNVLKEQPEKNPLDIVRRKYLSAIQKHTGRNIVAYYSGWLQKAGFPDTNINDKDKNALMVNIHKMDRSKGLDLILHTPGGDLAATESIIDYLRSMFGDNIRAIIPQISMSAGTVIALSCKEIIMGNQSNLGPIDPQMGGIACQAVLDEFKKALADVKANPSSAALWQVIIGKYHPTFLIACEQAIQWSKKMAAEWLKANMLKGKPAAVAKVLKTFGDHSRNKSHARHISKTQCHMAGLKIVDMEADHKLQDLI